MKRAFVFANALVVCVSILAGRAEGQGAPQTIDIAKVDVQQLSAGYRSSKVVGSAVVMMPTKLLVRLTTFL